MKTINSDHLRSFDKIKQQVFHSKKQEFKNSFREKVANKKPTQLKKIFPWRTLTKLTLLSASIYLGFNYTSRVVDYSIKKGFFNILDVLSLKIIRDDLVIKLKSFIKNPTGNNNLSHLANYMYQDKLDRDLKFLSKTYPIHQLKGTLHSAFKIWIFKFKNQQKSNYVNQYGDIVEKQENSMLKIWRYSVWKNKKEKVINEEKIHLYYRLIMQKNITKDKSAHQKQKQNNFLNDQEENRLTFQSKNITLSKQIQKQCKRINILNSFNEKYDDLLIECRNKVKIGQNITEALKNRQSLYKYPILHEQRFN